MPRGEEPIDLESLLLQETASESDAVELEIDPATGARLWRKRSDGALHHPTEPALVLPDGTRECYLKGVLESLDGAPSRILPDGTREWHAAGELESIDGAPSRILPDGTREWHQAGLLQSLDGAPSRLLPDGTREWHQADKLESLDGAPSRILPDGTRQWHREGVLSVIDDRPSVILANGTLRWDRGGFLDRIGKPAVICPTQEAQDHNQGLVCAYYSNGLPMRTNSEERENIQEEPCEIWAGQDPRLVFCEGYSEDGMEYYYYVVHADGREYLVSGGSGFILQAAANGKILDLGWHDEKDSAKDVAETLACFIQARSRRRNLSDLEIKAGE